MTLGLRGRNSGPPPSATFTLILLRFRPLKANCISSSLSTTPPSSLSWNYIKGPGKWPPQPFLTQNAAPHQRRGCSRTNSTYGSGWAKASSYRPCNVMDSRCESSMVSALQQRRFAAGKAIPPYRNRHPSRSKTKTAAGSKPSRTSVVAIAAILSVVCATSGVPAGVWP